MKAIDRRLTTLALNESLFADHMKFIVGPRQAGKTTTVQNWLTDNGYDLNHYFNWDNALIRRQHLKDPYFFAHLISKKKVPIVFDEIHKKTKWKNYLKGLYDTYKKDFDFIITGSGRLDQYQRGGDSLAGRYDLYHMMPLVPAEIEHRKMGHNLNPKEWLDSSPIKSTTFNDWLHLSGFPEPFLSGSKAKTRKWWEQYKVRVTEEDLRDLTKLESVDTMRTLLEVLPEKLMSPLSYNSLREDLQVSHATVKRYVKTLNTLFMIFEVAPYTRNITRSITKEKKTYFYYHPASEDESARHENALALILKTWVTYMSDSAKGRYELFYLRDQNRREVDFLITLNKKPQILFEAKLTDTNLAAQGVYFSKKLEIPYVQVVAGPNIKQKKPDGYVLSLDYVAAVL